VVPGTVDRVTLQRYGKSGNTLTWNILRVEQHIWVFKLGTTLRLGNDPTRDFMLLERLCRCCERVRRVDPS
jgi:hypothetical protein